MKITEIYKGFKLLWGMMLWVAGVYLIPNPIVIGVFFMITGWYLMNKYSENIRSDKMYAKCPECGCFCEHDDWSIHGDLAFRGTDYICRNFRCNMFGQVVRWMLWR